MSQRDTRRADAAIVVEGVSKRYPAPRRGEDPVVAVDDVSFRLEPGEALALVGASGSGKSTLAKLITGVEKPTEGTVRFGEVDVASLRRTGLRDLRKDVQMVFQDSYSSLNPRLPIEQSIAYGPKVQGAKPKAAKEQARALLDQVGLMPDRFGQRYPHELSGGQKQRVNIARALALDPRLLILDEAVSALDKSVEAQVLNLLGELKEKLNLTYIFISHDLHVVRFISDRVLVMYLGQVVEIGPVEKIYEDPKHPYTQALLACRLSMDPDERVEAAPLAGDPPNPVNPPSGCRFHTRCPYAVDRCKTEEPVLREAATGHQVACHLR